MSVLPPSEVPRLWHEAKECGSTKREDKDEEGKVPKQHVGHDRQAPGQVGDHP